MEAKAGGSAAGRSIGEEQLQGVDREEGSSFDKVHKVAFNVAVILNSLLLVAAFNVVFLMIVVSWLPDATYAGIIGETDPAFLSHRVHDSVNPILAWTMLVGTLVQLRHPRRRIAPLQMMLAIPFGFTLMELATGTLVLSENLPFIGMLLVAVLHPHARELVRFRTFDRAMLVLGAAAAISYLYFAYEQAQLQVLAGPVDPHAAKEHWTRMAVFGFLVASWALLGSSHRPGWRLSAWAAGLASGWYGLQSLLFPVASAANGAWALAAIAWGVAYIVIGERRARGRAGLLAQSGR